MRPGGGPVGDRMERALDVLTARIVRDGMRFDWTFQVVEPKLWLFAAGEDAEGRVVAHVDRVRVDGTEAKPIARGEGIAARAD